MKLFVISTLLLTFSISATAQIGGVVFEDVNKNNIFDKGDNPINGVVVTDGKHSVVSNEEGIYELPKYDEARFISVSTPSGYIYTTNFYHKVGESVKFDFPLKKNVNEQRRFIQIADSETYEYGDWIDDIKKYVENNNVAFINHAGDICYEKGLGFHKVNFSDKELGTRIVTTLGNHDLVGEHGSGEKMFETLFGPVWYSFNVGGVHFVNTAMPNGDKKPGYTEDQMIEWLEGDLAQLKEGTPIVIFNHDIVFNKGEYIYKTKDREFDLNKYNLRGWLYGHWHVNSFKQYGNVKVYGTAAPNKGGIDHSPSCFRVLEFDENGVISSELKYTSLKHNVVVNLTKKNTVIANLYSSASNVISAILKVGKNKYTLTQKSDWAWSVNLPENVDAKKGILSAQFDDGTIISSLVGIENSKKAPELEWAENYLGGNSYMSHPVLCGDNVVYATIDDNKALKCGLTAVNKKTGELSWSFKSHNSIKNTFVTDGKYIFAADVEGCLYKLDAKTGKLLGEMKMKEGALLIPNSLGITISDGVVYFGHRSHFFAVDSESFTELWSTDENGSGETSVTITVENGIVYTGNYWGGRRAYDTKTGVLLWSITDNGARLCVSSPTVYDNKLYFTATSNIQEVDSRTGKVLRLVNTGFKLATSSKPILTDKFIIVGTASEGVVAFNRETLQVAWNFKTKPALINTVAYMGNQEKTVESSLILKDDILYFGASDGYLYAINYDNGVFKWRCNIGSPIFSKIVIDDSIYVNDFGGTLYKMELGL